jgi:hypothetical protein
VPWVQPWFGSGAGVSALLGLPRNATTGRAYGGINILILWSNVAERGFTSQNWLTFRQALKLNAHVRKGEKGTTVVYADRFIPYRERTRAAETGDEPEAIPFLKRFTVFNADQCEDLPADIAPPPEPLAENSDPAKASSRAATFTPSPKMSSSSAITSPRLMPMRNLIRRASGTSGSRSAIARCTSTAQRTASTTLANSAKKPSPVFFTMIPASAQRDTAVLPR